MTSGYATPRPKVFVDEEKCGNAILCLECVKACRDKGFNCLGFAYKKVPSVGKDAPRRLEDIDHRIVAAFLVYCNGCEACVRACPKEALVVEMPPPRLPAIRVQRSDIVYCATLSDGTKVSHADPRPRSGGGTGGR